MADSSGNTLYKQDIDRKWLNKWKPEHALYVGTIYTVVEHYPFFPLPVWTCPWGIFQLKKWVYNQQYLHVLSGCSVRMSSVMLNSEKSLLCLEITVDTSFSILPCWLFVIVGIILHYVWVTSAVQKELWNNIRSDHLFIYFNDAACCFTFCCISFTVKLLNISILYCMDILLCHFGMVWQKNDDSWTGNVVVFMCPCTNITQIFTSLLQHKLVASVIFMYEQVIV
jgi:hypothetical protein